MRIQTYDLLDTDIFLLIIKIKYYIFYEYLARQQKAEKQAKPPLGGFGVLEGGKLCRLLLGFPKLLIFFSKPSYFFGTKLLSTTIY